MGLEAGPDFVIVVVFLRAFRQGASFLRRNSTGFRFALRIMVAIPLWQREGISSRLGVEDSCGTLVAIVGVEGVYDGFENGGCVVFGTGRSKLLIELRRRVIRLIWRMLELDMGGWSMVESAGWEGCAMGQIVCANSW